MCLHYMPEIIYEKADWSSVLDLTERVFTHFAGRGIA